jgi:hypothetical protein
MAVAGCVRSGLRRGKSVRPWPILDDNRLPKRFGEFRTNLAGSKIRRSTCAVGDDYSEGAVRITALCLGKGMGSGHEQPKKQHYVRSSHSVHDSSLFQYALNRGQLGARHPTDS